MEEKISRRASRRILIDPKQRRKKRTPEWQLYAVIVLTTLGVFFIILSQSPGMKQKPIKINTPADIVEDNLMARAAEKPLYEIKELVPDKIVQVVVTGHQCDTGLAAGIDEVAQTHEITQKTIMNNPGDAATHTLIDGLVISQPAASCSAVLYVEPI
ncbi:hypothetical protein KJ969_01405 [Patescibacteria group bacterium]|nr:hypothetical protein [Patescibacteria group bacterium]MBU1922560.1 hypothetical protein [Patescibacteria group bacterium]